PKRRVVENLNSLNKTPRGVTEFGFVKHLHRGISPEKGNGTKSNITRDSITVGEKATEEEEIGQDRNHNCVPKHYVRHNA
ncbi:hypothetical protein CMV_025002, partial [Castanea mollissima]